MNKYSYNKNKETFPNPPNNNIRSFSSNATRIDNKQINSRNYTYLNKQDNPLKNSNKQNIQNPRSPQPYSNLSYKENISAPSNSKNYFSPNPNQIPEKINLNGFKSESKNYPISMNYNSKKNKKTLILDLDETLVHSGFHPFNRKSDFTLNIKVDGKNHTIYVLKRPYVEEFLSQIAPYFEIIIFTASISEYASPLIDMLDKNKLTSGRLFRQHCLFNHGLYLKDIKIIKKDLKDTIIIDNNPVSYVMNQDNGLPILTWYDDLNDKELLNLIPLLKYLSTQNDVRDVIKNIVDRQSNKIKFDIVDDLIKKKINGNNIKKEIIYQKNDNYNKNNIKIIN
jgi:RNA polymerase II subunit A small phosphatase-like protein